MSATSTAGSKRGAGGCWDRYYCFSLICIVCFVAVPIIIVSILVAAITAVGYRSAKIEKYNKHTRGYSNSTFEGLSMSANGVPLTMQSVSTFTNYPTGDSCTMQGDPKDGCCNWPSKVYVASVPVSSSTTKITLKNEGTQAVIKDLPVSYTDVQRLSKSALMCELDYACSLECSKRGGSWSNNVCTIQGYLSTGCIRVIKNGNAVTVDKDGKLLSKLTRMLNGEGCEVSNSMKVFAHKSTATSSMIFMVRDYRDPYLMAQDLTFGCPTDSDTPKECFGIPDADTKAAISVLVTPVVIYTIAVAAISCCICALLRSQARKKRAAGGFMN